MIKTYGLTHIGLAVRDPERAFRFYERGLGLREIYREPGSIQGQTPGSRDVIVFERDGKAVGRMRGVTHFGFRLQDPDDIDAAVEEVKRAGGTVEDRGEFVPGEPYLFARDLDGYRIEIWFEKPGTMASK